MIKKATLTGLLLFGMFFGAGNLIFPPSLGPCPERIFGKRLVDLCCPGWALPFSPW
ncbi:branched-chain amino acid transport system II carrier protein [Aggregatibacter kilianii]|uniref:branched-chain amino acid transport system II carrier protein n=1 Tax=Aggregatibacter kilianii TaxID=2025884 RepID=UPI0031E6D7D5